jgi:hypothetical protein
MTDPLSITPDQNTSRRKRSRSPFTDEMSDFVRASSINIAMAYARTLADYSGRATLPGDIVFDISCAIRLTIVEAMAMERPA